MARKRKNNLDLDLPKYWHFKNGRFRYKVPAKFKHLFERTWIKLGSTMGEAHRTFAELPVHASPKVESIVTINDLADHYEMVVYPQNSAGTQANKRDYMPAIRDALGAVHVKQIRKRHGRALHKALKPLRGNKTAKETFGLLRHMMTEAEELGLVDLNPLLGIRIKSNKPRRRHVTYDEVNDFRENYAGQQISGYMKLKSITGMDKQMLLSLRKSDIQDDGVHTRRHKNDSLPKVYLWDKAGELAAAIDEIRSFNKKYRKVPSIYLFHNRRGQPYLPLVDGKMFDSEGHALGKPDGFNSIWQRKMKKWVEAGNEHFTEHDIRKTPASDTSTEHAQQLLDHKSPKMTKEVYQVGEKVVEINAPSKAK